MIDLGLIGLFFLAVAYGYRRGFIGQAIGLFGIVLSLLIAYSFSQDTAAFLQNQFPLPQSSRHSLIQSFLDMASAHQSFYLIVSFIILFIAARILCNVAGKFLQTLFELPILSFANRCLGAVFGVGKVFILVFIVAQFTPIMPDQWQQLIHQSVITQYMLDITPNFSDQIRGFPNMTEAVSI